IDFPEQLLGSSLTVTGHFKTSHEGSNQNKLRLFAPPGTGGDAKSRVELNPAGGSQLGFGDWCLVWATGSDATSTLRCTRE
ncbi:MAG TPA: hypothetical protein VGR14_15955, partial [Verrucomicrobiae bacterium]|nr:hypothetical protein [Verrucomicrobiae bacterium]